MKNHIIPVLTLSLLSTLAMSSTSEAAAQTDGKVQYIPGKLTLNPEPDNIGAPSPGGNYATKIPTNLNFGYHEIQTRVAETWVAKEVDTTDSPNVDTLQTRYDTAPTTVGTLGVEDNRGLLVGGGWSVKVKQDGEFKAITDNTHALSGTTLTINTGNVRNNLLNGLIGIVTPSTEDVILDSDGVEENILHADIGRGKGYTTLELNQFTLDVPKGQERIADVYQADVVWSLSTTP